MGKAYLLDIVILSEDNWSDIQSAAPFIVTLVFALLLELATLKNA